MTKNMPKRRSALDALRDGLAAFAPEIDPTAYNQHTQNYFQDCQPAGPVETHLVRVLAHTSWWLHHIPAIETNFLNEAIAKRQENATADQPPISSGLAIALAFCDQSKVLNKLSLHHERLSILFSKSLKQFLKMQADRRAAAACGPAQDGFVLSTDKIETRSQRNDRLKQAWNAPHYRA